MIKKIAFTLVLLTVLFSCKKHRLKGDREILVGNWEWVYSVKYKYSTNGSSFHDTILPSDVTSSYSVEFLKRGNVHLIENDEIKKKYRTVFKQFQITGSVPGCFINTDVYDFTIYRNNDEEHRIQGCVSSDSLMFYARDFPFIDEDNGFYIVVHENVFKRKN